MDIRTKVAETASSCNVSPVRIVVADRKRKSFKVNYINITSKLFLQKGLFISHESFSENWKKYL